MEEKKHYRDREPDKDLESMRMWKQREDEETPIDIEESLKIEYGGQTFHLNGFTECRRKDSEDLSFAYKIRKDETGLLCLYYVPDEKQDDDNVIKALATLKKLSESAGASMQDIRAHFDSALVEAESLKRQGNKQ